jgi:hypothetical protein
MYDYESHASYAVCFFFALLCQAFAEHSLKLRSFSIEGCGAVIDRDAARYFRNLSPSTLRYLTVLPREASDPMRSPDQPYLTDGAVAVMQSFWEQRPNVLVFTRRDRVRHKTIMFSRNNPAKASHNALSPVVYVTANAHYTARSSGDSGKVVTGVVPRYSLVRDVFGFNIDSGIAAERHYRSLVASGHIAAFRMYDEQQLLPRSYFA